VTRCCKVLSSGARRRASDSATPQLLRVWISPSSSRPAQRRNSLPSRARISPAAFLVKVMARMSCAGVPSSSARTMRATNIQVLPAPAQASTAIERAGSQAVA